MKKVSVATLRLDITKILAEVEQGESCIITRYNREIVRLTPPAHTAAVTPDQFLALLRATPLPSDWTAELKESTADLDGKDPWSGNS